jgi:hypothetical protein
MWIAVTNAWNTMDSGTCDHVKAMISRFPTGFIHCQCVEWLFCHESDKPINGKLHDVWSSQDTGRPKARIVPSRKPLGSVYRRETITSLLQKRGLRADVMDQHISSLSLRRNHIRPSSEGSSGTPYMVDNISLNTRSCCEFESQGDPLGKQRGPLPALVASFAHA